MTRIIGCNCRHEAQDEFHGKGMRVHNLLQGAKKGNDKSQQWRCTVCKSVK